MKKTILIIALIVLGGKLIYSQTNTFPTSGNVGIGTTSPNAVFSLGPTGGMKFYMYDNGSQQITQGFGVDLSGGPFESNWFGSSGPENQGFLSLGFRAHTNGGGAYSEKLRVTANGYVGIGVATPNAKLDLGSGYGSNGEKFLIYNDNTAGPLEGTKVGFYMDRFSLLNNSTYVFPTLPGYPGSYIIASKNTTSTTLIPRVTVLGESGNVGIGTISPEFPLDVIGTIRAKGLKLNLDKAADYVFANDYKLTPLSEVDAFIQTNKHLPGVPSADQFKKNGMDVSEMNNLLLLKMEEVTLYLIEQKKELENLKKENAILKSKVEAVLEK